MPDRQSHWKEFATTLATVVIAMVGFWLIEARDYITRDEAQVMIESQSPYLRDRAMILEKLTEGTSVNKELTQAVNDLRVELAHLRSVRTAENE